MRSRINVGKYSASIDLMDTPLEREGEIGFTCTVRGTYCPATYEDPESYDEEISDIEFDSPLSDDDAVTLCEWIDDRWGDICDPERIRWYEDD